MNLWTEPALRAEIEYRRDEMRRSFRRRGRWGRWGQRAIAQPAEPAPAARRPETPRVPRQRIAGPGEQPVPAGCGAKGADRQA